MDKSLISKAVSETLSRYRILGRRSSSYAFHPSVTCRVETEVVVQEVCQALDRVTCQPPAPVGVNPLCLADDATFVFVERPSHPYFDPARKTILKKGTLGGKAIYHQRMTEERRTFTVYSFKAGDTVCLYVEPASCVSHETYGQRVARETHSVEMEDRSQRYEAAREAHDALERQRHSRRATGCTCRACQHH